MENRFLTTFGITECRNLNAVIAVCRRFLTSFGITTFYVYYSERKGVWALPIPPSSFHLLLNAVIPNEVRNPKNNLYFRFI